MAKQRSKFSEFLHQRRGALRRRWKQILSDAYISRSTLHRIRHGDPYQPIAEVDSLRALANSLKFNTWADLVAAFEKGDVKAGLGPGTGATDAARGSMPAAGAAAPKAVQEEPVHEDALITLSKALKLPPTELVRRLAGGPSPAPSTGLPASLRMDLMRPAKLAPRFTSGVAASRRVEKFEDEDDESKQPVDTEDVRVFTIPVDGDCQEPVWKNGEIVVFSFDAFDREGILPGKSYYLAFTDGSTTFKRVFLDENDPDVYVLQCWNTAKYPQQKRVHFNEVVRIARAISKVVVPAEEGPESA